MKKVSTTTAKPSRNISRQRLTIGLDLGDRNSWYCVLDETGQIQLEQRVHTTVKLCRKSSAHAAQPSRTGNGKTFPLARAHPPAKNAGRVGQPVEES